MYLYASCLIWLLNAAYCTLLSTANKARKEQVQRMSSFIQQEAEHENDLTLTFGPTEAKPLTSAGHTFNELRKRDPYD